MIGYSNDVIRSGLYKDFWGACILWVDGFHECYGEQLTCEGFCAYPKVLVQPTLNYVFDITNHSDSSSQCVNDTNSSKFKYSNSAAAKSPSESYVRVRNSLPLK